MISKKFGERLRAMIGEKRGAQTRTGIITGIRPGTLHKYLSGQIPDPENLIKLAHALGVSTDYLLTGRDPPARLSPDELPQPVVRFVSSLEQAAAAAGERTEDFRAVPLVEDAVAAGSARVMSDQVEGWCWVYGPLVGRRSNLVAVRIAGDSMAPVLPPGSVAVVDRGDRLRISPRGIYMIKVDEGCGVKYLEQDGADLVLIPENRQYREQRITLEPGQDSPVVGRVVWSWSSWAPADPGDDAGQAGEKKARYKRRA